MAKKERKPRAPRFQALLEKEAARAAAKVQDESAALALDKYIAGLAKYANKTVGKFLDAVERDGAKDQILAMEISAVFGPMFAGGKGKRGGKKVVAAGGRLSKAENLKIQGQILDYVKAHPESKRKDIAKGLKIDKKKLFSPMKALMAGKKFATKGQKAGMTYSVK